MPGPFQRRNTPGRGSAVYERLRGTFLANDPLPEAAARADDPSSEDSPWHYFDLAARAAEASEKEKAKEHLRAVLTLPEVESRPYLQAWHGLRALGERPGAEETGQVLGVLVEVFVKSGGGLDAVAAYRDTSARYFNHSGAAVIWGRFNAARTWMSPPACFWRWGKSWPTAPRHTRMGWRCHPRRQRAVWRGSLRLRPAGCTCAKGR